MTVPPSPRRPSRRVEHLHEALRDPTTRNEALELIRSLIDEICLVPEDGVELRGELTGILV
jgi:site-specific DNA recombinase